MLLVAAIEFAAGFFLPSLQAVSNSRTSKTDTVSATLAWLWANPAPLREDADFLWRNQPGAARTQFVNPQAFGSTEQWRIENNSSGFRGPEVRSARSAESAYRILCIGDSVTFGFNADQDDSYPAQLARLLRAKQPDRDFEIINAGVPGWTWLQGVRFLEREGLALEPDLVIISHGSNDQTMPALISDAERFEHADDPRVKQLAKMRSLVADTNIYLFIEHQVGVAPPPDKPSPGCQQQIDVYGRCTRVSPGQIEAAVVNAGRLANSAGVDLLVLNLDFLNTPAVEASRKGAEAAGITFVDLAHQMDFMRAREQRLHSDELGLIPSRDRASQPLQGPRVRQRRVIFRVQTPDTVASYSVRGHVPYVGDFEFSTPLNDEGLDGDEKPGDGVFSGTEVLPPGIGLLGYMFYRGEDREFQPLPPMNSRFGDRYLSVEYNLTTPVFRFAERFMMAERTHPNADGYGMVAETVAFEIGKRQSFHR